MLLASAAIVAASASMTLARENLHFTYLWHLEQPVYWPDRQASGADRYERAWESILRKDGGAPNPADNLREIFGLADRQAAYQYRVRDSINAIRWASEAGAQVSFSGGLIENLTSLGNASQLGYGPTWFNWKREARGWRTASGNQPRLDVVLFSFHHALLPLLDENAVRKEIALYKRLYGDAWGSTAPMSRGFFPSEMAFSTRLIKPLAEEGIAWTVVSGEKISRANANFPVIYGSGGINCDPPNKADQVNPAQSDYYRLSISRGCAPAEAYPQAFTPQRARSIDPATGQVHEIIVVPATQSLSWKDGYAPLGTGDFAALNQRNDPSRPMLAMLAHDGDNAWGGGFSYYLEATPNLVSQAQSQGYIATTVEQYLSDHPVPASAVVHVEDGAWVNADGDFGAPQFINWNWPLLNAQGQIDVENGWHEDPRNWAVITAAQNRVETAEQIQGAARIEKILYPDALATSSERAWHYFLGGLNSGFMYYGTALDHEVKQTIACNEAMRLADPVIGNAAADTTPPTIWAPQRHPWNPGSVNFGPQYGYQQRTLGSDFWVWTFAYDASGMQGVTLKYRIDGDGVNPLASWQNELYSGGAEVGAWQEIAMTRRIFPAGNVYSDPNISFFEMPQYIADQYHAKVTGLQNVLVDYYIEAVDSKGYVKRSPIEHVWVGDAAPTGGGGGDVVVVAPNPPVAGQNVTITYDPASRPLAGSATVRAHIGFNNWATVLNPDPAMTWNPATSRWVLGVTVASSATQMDVVFNDGAGAWDNNGGQDWHFQTTGATAPPFQMDGVLDGGTVVVSTNGSMFLRAGLQGDVLYIAAPDAGEGNDHFIYLAGQGGPGPMQAANWAKAGQIARWDAFLADENSNGFSGWFDATGTRQSATGANGGVLEGTINLREEFGGVMPTHVSLALAAYGNSDGGALVPSAQVPPAVVSNGNIEASEYAVLDLSIFAPPPVFCPGDADASGAVTFADITSVLAAFGSSCAPGSSVCAGDANNDRSVDFADITTVLANFGVGCP